jgi:hypothetical protein
MKFLLIFSLAVVLAGCTAKSPEISNTTAPERNDRARTVLSHGPEVQDPAIKNTNIATGQPGAKTKWTQGGDAIDTSGFDLAIASAEKDAKSKPSDDAAALGDYRRALKYDPENSDAKEWIDKIIMIYDSMNKESPPEGQEPPPLPFKGK